MRSILLLPVASIFSIACPLSPAAVEAETARIVVIGSSTAFGVGPRDPENAWVNVLDRTVVEGDPAAFVVNLSFPGITTYGVVPSGAERADRPTPYTDGNITAALELNPTDVIVNLPSNDQDHGFSADEQVANFDLVVAAGQNAGARVWVTTTQPRNFDDEVDRQALFDVALAITERYENVFDFWTDIPDAALFIKLELDSGDGIHLNDDAHLILADRAITTLAASGRIAAP